MYQISAHAVRTKGTIEVTVSGFLPDSCHEARIKDIYPGGNIVYVKDPGYAQVFVTEYNKPSTGACLMVLVPFIATTYIYDTEHKEVQIFLNGQVVLTVPVTNPGDKFIVIQLTGGFVPNGHCSIIPADALYLAIYTQKFGPDTFDACQDWINNNCTGIMRQSLVSVNSGGSEAPRK